MMEPMTPKNGTFWNVPLPLYDDVVFVDWHGVLSHATFWETYTPVDGGPEVSEVQMAVWRLFKNETLINRWMRGQLSTFQIVDQYLLENVPSDREAESLRATLLEECEATKTDAWMTACIQVLRRSHHIVLATDNMDCFVDGIRLRRDLVGLFDDYISSSEVGVLKSENPERFFGTWLERRDISPARTVLIDDSRLNCDSFERLGGRGIFFKGHEGMAAVLELLWPMTIAP